MEVFQNYGYLFGDLYNKDYSILGSIVGYPNFGKLPHGTAEEVAAELPVWPDLSALFPQGSKDPNNKVLGPKYH